MLGHQLAAFERLLMVGQWVEQFCGAYYGRRALGNFLAMDGASRFGKTQLAISCFGQERANACKYQDWAHF